MTEKIEVENINTPGKITRVDRAKYEAMKSAMLATLPKSAPGMTAKESKDAAKAHLPEALFPGGATSGWWQKCVQLDLEAKGVIVRENSKPLRFHQV
ncbi:DUF6958 family protein [Yoonia sediminilitoris]|uniref:Uncharacterized protein n=1 Tax=Yoonia sediminilitoris TaxID=1286148 RepID=A0A2T6KPW1_9RHOB|nr:hypothetical protein [Yoonia sediminilitoris]PUB18578.1 hypothetical protein C8N45_101162 [Yoonia sediminilitoris]RCW98746.1 hypothetical protein DFP92_101162 [Yoonia sediminilitoris]